MPHKFYTSVANSERKITIFHITFEIIQEFETPPYSPGFVTILPFAFFLGHALQLARVTSEFKMSITLRQQVHM